MDTLTVEGLCIVVVGAIMHLSNFSIISALNSKATVLIPNAASLLLAVTLLALLTQWRPCLSSRMASTRSQYVLLLMLELMVIMGLVELILLQIWVPMLIVLNVVCEFTTYALLMANNEYLVERNPHFAHWLRSKAFYQARFLLALTISIGIFLSQGWQSVVLKFLQNAPLPMRRGNMNVQRTIRGGPAAEVEERIVEDRETNQPTHRERVRYVPLGGGQELEEEYYC